MLAWADFDNDGDLDLFVAGSRDQGAIAVTFTRLYRNDGGQFVDTGIQLPPFRSGSAEWGDFDNDGFVDLLLTGITETEPFAAQVWRNQGGTNLVLHSLLPFVSGGRATWGDFNQDGFLDIAVTGTGTGNRGTLSRIYLDQRGTNFVEAAVLSPEFYGGTVDWADYDMDGDPDLLLSGDVTGEIGALRFGAHLYRNDDGTFVEQQQLIVASAVRGQWFDADNDGWPDLLITAHSSGTSLVFHNDPRDGFREMGRLPMLGTVAIGDMDNDGFNDILISGYYYSATLHNFVYGATRLYQSTGPNQWIELTNVIQGGYGPSAWGDYDNDGRLDLVVAGWEGPGVERSVTRLWRNVVTTTNHPPSAPRDLAAHPRGDRIESNWGVAHDLEQSGGLTYNVRIGVQPGAGDVVSPMSATDGYRRIVHRGNAEGRTNFFIRDLPPGLIYYWSVQAVDNGFAGSVFAPEGSFYVSYPPVISAATNLIIYEDEVLQFQVGLTDLDSSADQLQLSVQSTNVILFPPDGIRVTRQDTNWNVRLQPGRDQNGTTTLLLHATDETGRSSRASVTVQVLPVNDRPVSASQSLRMLEDTTLPVVLFGSDVEGDPLQFIITRGPIHGTLEGQGPQLIYRPETNYFGIDRFFYLVGDGTTNSTVATVDIQIAPVVDVPILTFPSLIRADGRFELRFHGEPRQMYRIESSVDLRAWREESTVQASSGDVWIDDPVDFPQRFFRFLPIP